MAFSPYDWNETVRHRTEYIERRLREGSPVVGLSLPEGALLLTLRRNQRKVFEIYDRLMFSALGHQADIESIRLAAIDFSHTEGFSRSPDDVTIQRVVGSAISPILRRAYGDPFGSPFVLRALFAELARNPSEDQFYILNYDGEFEVAQEIAAIAGTAEAERKMLERLKAESPFSGLDQAIPSALRAWALGRGLVTGDYNEEAPFKEKERALEKVLKEARESGLTPEAGLLERNTHRESKFRLVEPGVLLKFFPD